VLLVELVLLEAREFGELRDVLGDCVVGDVHEPFQVLAMKRGGGCPG